MLNLTRRRIRRISLLSAIVIILYIFGVFTHLLEVDFDTKFRYPYDGDIEELVLQLRLNITPKVAPINSYSYHYYKSCRQKCAEVTDLRLVYIIKSAPANFHRRTAIRSTWGFERRFSDVEMRTVFLIGQTTDLKIIETLNKESAKFGDIVQGNFTDSYYNNTLKTMMGFDWAVKFCKSARFYMFMDDDYYVSTKNVLRFIRNPVNYPKYLKTQPDLAALSQLNHRNRKLRQFDVDLKDDVRLYSGYVFKSAPHRHFPSKWYVSLDEYPYDSWPPYVTAGAYILSRESLFDMYFASFYTKHFKFDDVYVGLLAFKCKIEPFHSEEFYFKKKSYDPKSYEFVVASHGFEDGDELLNVWTHQRSLGNA